jgi:hypothetical protein
MQACKEHKNGSKTWKKKLKTKSGSGKRQKRDV